MILYVGLVHPVDREYEEQFEAIIQEWFLRNRERFGINGVYPYDPILREIAIDIGEQAEEPVADSLGDAIRTLGPAGSDVSIGSASVLDGLSGSQRGDHVRRKLLYLLDALRQMNENLESKRVRQVEYLLAGIATEMVDIIQTGESPSSAQIEPAPLEEKFSRKLDDFWEKL